MLIVLEEGNRVFSCIIKLFSCDEYMDWYRYVDNLRSRIGNLHLLSLAKVYQVYKTIFKLRILTYPSSLLHGKFTEQKVQEEL